MTYHAFPAKDELLDRLKNQEDSFTERKLEGAHKDYRKTIVAFANSVPEGRTAVLYIGVNNDGEIAGVSNPDSLQKSIHEFCKQDCYPPIDEYSTEVLNRDGKDVLAVVIFLSKNRPHFSGPAYIRKGSQSIVASQALFDELVATRLSKPHQILKWKNKTVTVEITFPIDLAQRLDSPEVRFAAVVEDCNPHFVRIRDTRGDREISKSLDDVKLEWDSSNNRLKLILAN